MKTEIFAWQNFSLSVGLHSKAPAICTGKKTSSFEAEALIRL